MLTLTVILYLLGVALTFTTLVDEGARDDEASFHPFAAMIMALIWPYYAAHAMAAMIHFLYFRSTKHPTERPAEYPAERPAERPVTKKGGDDV